MMIAVTFLAAFAILSAEAQQSVSISLLLPDGLFYPSPPLQPPTFVGQVTVTRSTTYYTLDCNGPTSFNPGDCTDGSYTFLEISSNTQYLVESISDFLEAAPASGTGAASSSTYEVLQIWTINCGPSPFGTSSGAVCTSTYTADEDTTSIYTTTSTESSFYPVFFTVAAGYSQASSTVATSATPSPSPAAPTAKSTNTSTTTAHPALGPSSKVGIGLGVPLGACAFAGVALLLYRHGKHKERSRMSQMGKLAPPAGFAFASDGKRLSEAGMAGQTLGRQPPVYSMEMQG
ncbi:MAG: hypothetical protein Q9175_005186 [Cornicularia normoerica]